MELNKTLFLILLAMACVPILVYQEMPVRLDKEIIVEHWKPPVVDPRSWSQIGAKEFYRENFGVDIICQEGDCCERFGIDFIND
jgi:hypothetical protein